MTKESYTRPPVALEQRGVSADQRMFSPSAARNLVPMPNLTWCPSDPDSEARVSAASWIKFTGLSNVHAPLDIDVCAEAWGVEQIVPFDAIVSLNMVHIAPWAASLGLFAGAGRLLCAGGLLFLYGPFMRDGKHNAPSNAEFDASLKARNPSWGLRDIADLERLGESSGLRLRNAIEMPSNNMSLVFAKVGGSTPTSDPVKSY